MSVESDGWAVFYGGGPRDKKVVIQVTGMQSQALYEGDIFQVLSDEFVLAEFKIVSIEVPKSMAEIMEESARYGN